MNSLVKAIIVSLLIMMFIVVAGSTNQEPQPVSTTEISRLQEIISQQKKTIHEQQEVMTELIKTFMHIPESPDRSKLTGNTDTKLAINIDEN